VSRLFLRMIQIARAPLSLVAAHVQVPGGLWIRAQSVSQILGQTL
jgi:hypothetical protein